MMYEPAVGLRADDDLHELVMLIGVLSLQGDVPRHIEAGHLVEAAVDLFLTGQAMLPWPVGWSEPCSWVQGAVGGLYRSALADKEGVR
jgi:hypothetical protein